MAFLPKNETTPVSDVVSSPESGSMSVMGILQQPRTIASLYVCGSAYPARAGTGQRMLGKSSALTPHPHGASLKGSCSVPAPSSLAKNVLSVMGMFRQLRAGRA